MVDAGDERCVYEFKVSRSLGWRNSLCRTFKGAASAAPLTASIVVTVVGMCIFDSGDVGLGIGWADFVRVGANVGQSVVQDGCCVKTVCGSEMAYVVVRKGKRFGRDQTKSYELDTEAMVRL